MSPVFAGLCMAGVLVVSQVASAQQAPTQPTCEQRLIAVFGQYQQAIASNGEREAAIRADYEQRITALQKEVQDAKAPKAAQAPAPAKEQ